MATKNPFEQKPPANAAVPDTGADTSVGLEPPAVTPSTSNRYRQADADATTFINSFQAGDYTPYHWQHPGWSTHPTGQISTYPSSRLAEWQKGLIKAGLIPANARIHVGIPDEFTMDATQKVFRTMKDSGIPDPNQALAMLGATTVDLGNAGRNPFVAPTRRPMDQPTLVSGIQKAFDSLYGRAPNKQELDHFAAAFRGQESTFFGQQESAAKQRYDAGADVGGGEVSGGEGVAVGRLTSPTTLTEQSLQGTNEAVNWNVGMGLYKVLKELEAGRI